jgi:DNA-binding LacI/PurR family transcriptional regulator
MRVTINDIAKASGFSKTSVSFAFNDPTRISKETRNKILNIAESLGYVPDPVARNLSMRKVGTIGFLVPQAISRVFLNPYMNQILLGIGEACQNQDYSLTVVPPLRGRIFDGVRSAAVDGFITMGLHPEMKVVQLIRQRHIPFVTIDGTPSDEIPGVNTHDEDSAYDMMSHILSFGHRDIAIFALEYARGTEDDVYTGARDWRLNGFQRALRERGIEGELIIDAETSLEGGRAAVATMFERRGGKLPSAIACMSDISAIGAISELKDRGCNVPDDISVTGFDDIPESSLISPRLTTISQPGFDIGNRSASMLFSLLEEKKPENHIYFDSPYLQRDSLATAP